MRPPYRFVTRLRPRVLGIVSIATMVAWMAGCVSAGMNTRTGTVPDSMASLDGVPPRPTGSIPLGMRPDRITIRYLGTGGWLIQAGDHAIMTGPLFSNPDLLSVLAGTIAADTQRIRQGMTNVEGAPVEAILIGHGHYDHLMDTPYVVNHYFRDSRVYGSETVRNLVMNLVADTGQVVAIRPGDAAYKDKEGTWFTSESRRFRWMAIRSRHSDHFWKIQLFKGDVKQPVRQPPNRASGWKVGQTYAYIVDVLDEHALPVLRIYYNDSPSTSPYGMPPASTAPPAGVPTVAILTAPGYKWEKRYPEDLIAALKPAWVLTSHWEDFFVAQSEDPHPIVGTFFGGFVERMNALPDLRWSVPYPQDVIVFGGR